jgi:radial spoke head protein 3
MDIQTDNFLEEISDRAIEAEAETQTDAFLDRPATPLFVPMKTGLDVETQIYPNDLFDFDFEVQPLLDVMVGKTLEQALLEVLEEDELSNIRAHQEEFDQMRAAELAEVQRMEEAERRREQEKVPFSPQSRSLLTSARLSG